VTERQLAAPLVALLRARLPWVILTGGITLWTLIHDIGFRLAKVLLAGGAQKLSALVGLLNVAAIFLSFAALSVFAVQLWRLNASSDVAALDRALAAEARYWKVLALAVLPTYALSSIFHMLVLRVFNG
jgi:hypothetical protein